ncbi:hypothetical protein [Microbacterium rhizophilus]|uniref:hypothetical protein n=1 Tax=Microbacterium rhizophilus TaxID=3138934 RepID=UPI0031EC8B58
MLRAAVGALWAVEAAAAVASVIDPGASLVGRFTAQWSFAVGGAVTALTALIALAGIVMNRWRLEWLGAAVAPLGAIPYLVTAWWVLLDDGFGAARAITATFLVAYPLLRSAHCMAFSNRMRDLATPSTPISVTKGDSA